MVRTIDLMGLRRKGERYLDSAFGTPAGDHFVLAEVGSSQSYDRYHIQRAVHFPLEALEKQAKVWIPNAACDVILYGDRSQIPEAIRILSRQGFHNLYVYLGGKEEWRAASLPIRSSLVPADHLDWSA